MKLLLVLCFILFSGGLCYASVTHNMDANATSNTHEIATLTASAATATKTTATANAAATRNTVIASTATAQAQATAAIIQNNPYPSYFPSANGKLALYDPLKDDSEGHQWLPTEPLQLPSFNGNCLFKEEGLDAHVEGDKNQSIYFHPCIANTTSFSNFAFEVHMKLFAGDCGGVTFRGQGDAFYYFIACQNGQYRLVKYVNDQTTPIILKNESSPYINMSLNQDNVIAVWANGATINLYLNGQLINSIQDTSYSFGQIGVLVRSQNLNTLTEAVFSDACVWTLT